MTLEEYMKREGLKTSALDEFLQFKEDLLEYNKITNITRITEEEEFYVKHYLDSLSLLKEGLIAPHSRLLDLGTGGGFPGIPLKIYDSTLQITLMDSLNKRIVFLNEEIKKLGLNNITALHGRAEEMAREATHREQYDIVTSRAVANLRTLVEYALAFVKVGGIFISMKGPEYQEELSEAQQAIALMGGKLGKIVEVDLPMDIKHYLLVIEKTSATPKKYPRGGGKPKNKPL